MSNAMEKSLEAKPKGKLTKLKELGLNLNQEQFCRLYATEREFFGNGVECYIEVYQPNKSKPNWYQMACSSASRMLSNVKVIDRINDILEETGFNDSFVDKQLSFLVAQHADFNSKLGAIKEYNKLKSRITEKSIVGIINIKPLATLDDLRKDHGHAPNSELREKN